MTPRIETSDNTFKIILPNLNYVSVPEKAIQANAGKASIEEKTLDFAKKKGGITRKELQIFLNISQSSCGRILKKMVESGMLIQEGRGKNTAYHPAQQQH